MQQNLTKTSFITNSPTKFFYVTRDQSRSKQNQFRTPNLNVGQRKCPTKGVVILLRLFLPRRGSRRLRRTPTGFSLSGEGVPSHCSVSFWVHSGTGRRRWCKSLCTRLRTCQVRITTQLHSVKDYVNPRWRTIQGRVNTSKPDGVNILDRNERETDEKKGVPYGKTLRVERFQDL